jgi:hypothetical protein
MEVWGNSGIETQTGGPQLVVTVKATRDGVGQDMPGPGSWVANDVAARRRQRTRGRELGLGGTAEKEAVAGIHDGDILIPGHEGKWATDQGRPLCLPEIGESPRPVRCAVDEAGKGLGEPPAVVRVRDEAAPAPRDALGAAERLDGHLRQVAAP